MHTLDPSRGGQPQALAWDAQLTAIEAGLTRLDEAFASGQPELVEAGAQSLQGALAQAAHVLRGVQGGAIPPELLMRLTQAQARARSHQAAITRGRVATDRTLQVLLGPAADSTYQALGQRPGSPASAYR